jgi:CBS domain-containing protein
MAIDTVKARLQEISDRLEAGGTVHPITVRELLGWFGARRRGRNVVEEVRQTLYDNNLHTEPDFPYAYFDGPVELRLGKRERDEESELIEDFTELFDLPESAEQSDRKQDSSSSAEILAFPRNTDASEDRFVTKDPTYRIGKLTAANTPPVSVKPNDSLATAITIMMANNFSQLPVMTNERDVKGVISWESIGTRLAMGRACTEVRGCMDEPIVIPENTSLFDAIEPIVKHQYVLVRDSVQKISGIVTSADLSMTFREKVEPFLLIDEIENHIRTLIIRSRFTPSQLAAAAAAADQTRGREIKTAFDLTIGDYIRLLENPE